MQAVEPAATQQGALHSSAKFYICGEQGIYPVFNFRELDDMDVNSFTE